VPDKKPTGSSPDPEQGPQGEQGPRGIPGVPGHDGATGPAGPPGDSRFGTFSHLSDDELMAFIEKEGNKDDSVLAKLIMIQRIRGSLVKERRGQRILTAAAIALSGLALIVGIGGYYALQRFEDQRNERTVTACQKDRSDAIKFNEGLEQQAASLYFIEAVSVAGDTDPATLASNAFLATVIDGRINGSPGSPGIRDSYAKVRKCDPQSIDDYTNSHGKFGFEDGPMVKQAKFEDALKLTPELQKQLDDLIASQQKQPGAVG
jgi:hypothetical protein